MTPEDYNEIANLFESLARKFREVASEQDSQRHEEAQVLPTEGDEPFADRVLAVARRVHPQLGDAQVPALQLVAEAHPDGTTVGAVAKAVNKDHTGAHMLLNGGLLRLGLLRRDEQASPMRYYLGPRILAFFADPDQVA